MTVFSDLRGASRTFWATTVLAAVALTACGGGTSQVEAFTPNRVIAFGDDTSVIVNDGLNNGYKYSVNGVDTNTAVRDCRLLPNWVQAVASHYSMVFAECNQDSLTPRAIMRAKLGATVDDAVIGLDAQLAEQSSTGEGVKTGDLVTVLLGMNDMLKLSDSVEAGTMSNDDAVNESRARGKRLASMINSILASGARAIVVTIPDMGLSPYALERDKSNAGVAARLSTMSYEFNAYLRTGIDSTRFDGRNYGLVLADDMTRQMSRYPGSYGLSNVTVGVCLKVLPDCTNISNDFISSDATATGYMWADATRVSPQVQTYIGNQAVSRAANNPF